MTDADCTPGREPRSVAASFYDDDDDESNVALMTAETVNIRLYSMSRRLTQF